MKKVENNILKIGIYIAIAGMTIKYFMGDTDGVLLCGFSLIALLVIDIKLTLVKENPINIEDKEIIK